MRRIWVVIRVHLRHLWLIPLLFERFGFFGTPRKRGG
jgi:hypothetical protein